MNETPQQRFQKTPHGKTWTDFTDSPQFKAASDAALLQYGVRLGQPDDMVGAAANEFRRQGARDALHILANLGIVEEPVIKKKPRTVDHAA